MKGWSVWQMEQRASFWSVGAPLHTNAAGDECSEGGAEGSTRERVTLGLRRGREG